jgi:DNA topoisomerase IB
MFQYGIGFKSTDQRRGYYKKRKRIKKFIVVDETLLKVGNNEYMHGFGLLSSR